VSAPSAGGALVHVPVGEIVTGLNNRTRFDPQALADLAADIASRGLLQPVVVRPNPTGSGYQLIAGERRLRAVKQLGWAEIPATLRDLDDRAARGAMMAENTHRADVDPIDEAQGYAAFMRDFGVDEAETARAANVEPQRVYRRLSLLRLLPDLQAMLRRRPELIAHLELLTKLDHNHQHAALVTLNERDDVRLPEFRRIVHALLQRQAQAAQLDMFEADDLGKTFARRLAEAAANGRRMRVAELPIDPRFPAPKVRNRQRFLANQWKDWADELAAAGFAEAAAAVYTLIETCIREGRIEANESEWVAQTSTQRA
jgi:ParB/RepB/Spo0J family partition protein